MPAHEPQVEETFVDEFSEHIWKTHYRHRPDQGGEETTISDTWQRVANAVAGMEPHNRSAWAREFYQILAGFQFLPGGRILAGAGSAKEVTLFNCFVMGTLEGTVDGVLTALKEGLLTLQFGGGVGYDFSSLEPTPGAPGPIATMGLFHQALETFQSGIGTRRAAVMATLRCDHPDIESFICAKRERHKLTDFNLSVLVTDDFMRAVRHDDDWPLVFPMPRPGEQANTHRIIKARALWEEIARYAHHGAEPGVLFIERINQANNLAYRETIVATNPCGEVPLPPYGGCALGSVNLARFVRFPFSTDAHVDMSALTHTVNIAVRMLDNVIDLSRFALLKQQREAIATRRIGIGITGLADMLFMLGLDYDAPAGRDRAAQIVRSIRDTAYHSSVCLALNKGHFPAYKAGPYLEAPFIRKLPESVRAKMRGSGIRNSHLLAIAPAGTISLLAGNVSSGIEPVFAECYERRVREKNGQYVTYSIEDYACRLRRSLSTDSPRAKLYPVSSNAQVAMQAALQPFVDNAISKTVTMDRAADHRAVAAIYQQAYELGLKGCTVFRPNPVTGAILSTSDSCRGG